MKMTAHTDHQSSDASIVMHKQPSLLMMISEAKIKWQSEPGIGERIMTNKEQFEKWLTETYPWGEEELEKAFFQEEYQYYISDSNALHFAWAGWKARGEVRVELPNYIDCDHDDELGIEYNRGIAHCDTHLKSQGVKVKLILMDIREESHDQ
nr:hypothetical protein [Photorhabdus temperata]